MDKMTTNPAIVLVFEGNTVEHLAEWGNVYNSEFDLTAALVPAIGIKARHWRKKYREVEQTLNEKGLQPVIIFFAAQGVEINEVFGTILNLNT